MAHCGKGSFGKLGRVSCPNFDGERQNFFAPEDKVCKEGTDPGSFGIDWRSDRMVRRSGTRSFSFATRYFRSTYLERSTPNNLASHRPSLRSILQSGGALQFATRHRIPMDTGQTNQHFSERRVVLRLCSE